MGTKLPIWPPITLLTITWSVNLQMEDARTFLIFTFEDFCEILKKVQFGFCFLFALLFEYFRKIRSVETHFFTFVGMGLRSKTFSQCIPLSCFTLDHKFKVWVITLVCVFVPWTIIHTCECGLHYHIKICEFLISVNIAHFSTHIVG